MPRKFYENRKFALDSANGEARKLFGDPTALNPAPTIEIAIVDADASVKFTVAGAQGDPGRDFSKEATARYIDGAYFDQTNFPDPNNDIIIGHLNWADANDRQLFLMWVRQPGGPGTDYKLQFFIFEHDVRFSSCAGPMKKIEAAGEENGGGSGTGK